MKRRWYALLAETDSYAPGVHFLNWDQELRPELDRLGISYELAQGFGTELEAQNHIEQHGDKLRFNAGTERHRKARAQRGRCWYCGRILNMQTTRQDDSAEIEHQTPRSRGLPICTQDRNKVTSCRACNNSAGNGKGDRTLAEYRAHLLKNMPGKAHLFFYGEWLDLVRLAQAGRFGMKGLQRVTYTFVLHHERTLGFPQELLLVDLAGSA
ncbi:HNH endonuclease [Deinococcus fonticola]|uniref:HNH endonuclease n=1 Tax=Deinococcus fonticola TaxID=2528713 RepID=UPI001075354C|nr:HNH endonuclease domain-containing protein [Deinococcus fonticola]